MAAMLIALGCGSAHATRFAVLLDTGNKDDDVELSNVESITMEDLVIFSESWLTANAYRDIWPRRGGDGRVSLEDFALFGLHWLEAWE